ncbi:alkylresorcinol/alkylpyrone synthase [Saccharopolyspora lacisalsi]|uniref:Alkylresorcinol/alkylpyrone synthase n=1 Tax=Halosaccharopolyspora lacisalsi TaxID=1000566 RepID=A0A839E9J9_9PSEU|nr:3-oxoacyl-[acyl-carrier-protein] synthase III C-terminal domain-containing protein [Halosaccharopolyspora lacisalsi]MBA8827518.1 alkylresorcinol/alkylpyrone synthase [Halosaccharopolyspora lacisalsi]
MDRTTPEPTRQDAFHAPGPAPRVAAVELALPPHVYRQDEVLDAFTEDILTVDPPDRRVAARISANAGVHTRHFALPLERVTALDSFTDTNAAYLDAALDLGESALKQALDTAGIAPDEVDTVVSTTVTGLAVPSLEARLAQRVGLRSDVKRVPLFGLGCVAGAAGLARIHDHLRAQPDEVAVLLSVELCSLTAQRDDTSMANMVGSSLFGDGAAAAVVVGAARAADGPEIISSRSRLYPDTERVMGWDIGASGFRLVLSADVPTIAEEHLGKDVSAFLADHGLHLDDVATWVCHPGGPKVIEAIERTLDLPADALAHTRASLARNGNLSSASVLDVLRDTLADPRPAKGAPGVLMAMGPGFCSELVLLRW